MRAAGSPPLPYSENGAQSVVKTETCSKQIFWGCQNLALKVPKAVPKHPWLSWNACSLKMDNHKGLASCCS